MKCISKHNDPIWCRKHFYRINYMMSFTDNGSLQPLPNSFDIMPEMSDVNGSLVKLVIMPVSHLEGPSN